MKKALKIILIVILVLFAAIIFTPIIFKGKINKVAQEKINENINAVVTFEDISLSLIKHFPNVSLTIENLSVVGIEAFEGDTLIAFEKLSVSVNAVSAIRMENIMIRTISLESPRIHAIILKDGSANWDIAKEVEEEEAEEVVEEEAEFETKIKLKKLSIENAFISYVDDSSGMKASLDNFNFTLTGDFSQDEAVLKINSHTAKLNFMMDGIKYLKDVALNMKFDIDANMAQGKYVLKENEVALNELALLFEGSFEQPDTSTMNFDIAFGTRSTDFKTLLSLVPAVYMNDFQDLRTTGKLKLEGYVKGTMKDEQLPNVGLELDVKNASFRYPDLPKAAEKIQIDIEAFYDGAVMDNSTLDINKFHVELGGNPFDLHLQVKQPESDPFTNGHLYTRLDLSTFADVIPLEDTKLKGIITSQLDWMGKLSYIENEEYERFKADGNLTIDDFFYSSADMPYSTSIYSTSFSFSPQYLAVNSFNANIGESDFHMSGKITDYIPYALKDETIRGDFKFSSTKINVNEFMTEEVEEEETEELPDTVPLEVIIVPDNIDFKLSSNIDYILYDKLEMTKVGGVIKVTEGRLVLEGLGMNTLQGSMKVSGEYNTQDKKHPFVDFNFDASKIDIPAAFDAFESLNSIAPIASKATGKVSVGMKYKSFLARDMKPITQTIEGEGDLSSNQIGIKDVKAFNTLGDKLKTDVFDNMVLKDVDIHFIIEEGTLTVEPFTTTMGSTTLEVFGEHSLNDSLNYGINVSMPRSVLGPASSAIDNLYAGAASKGLDFSKNETMAFLVKITGSVFDPKVSLNTRENIQNIKENIKEEVKEEVKKVVDEGKAELKAKADKILADAQKKANAIKSEAKKSADKVRKESKTAADKVRAEANANADKLVKEAKNPIAKKAAEQTAKKMKEEGEKKAKGIENEGEKKAKGIENEAAKKADKIMDDARKKSDAMLK